MIGIPKHVIFRRPYFGYGYVDIEGKDHFSRFFIKLKINEKGEIVPYLTLIAKKAQLKKDKIKIA